MMSQENPDIEAITERLRERGLRMTPQRMAVLNTLIGSQEHLSAEMIYNRVRVDFPMIGLATVYKTVSMLKEMGEITELNFDNGCALYDGSRSAPHPHFICTDCQAIIDLDEKMLEDLSEVVARRTGYTINHYRLDFFGICPECQ